jgi:hypothetical protein
MALEDDSADVSDESTSDSGTDDTETTESERESEGTESTDDENEGQESSDDSEDEADPTNPFENLTAEDLQAIKSNPALSKTYKGLVRAATAKFQKAGEAMKLSEAYERDPVGVAQAIAQSLGYRMVPPEQHQQQEDPYEAQQRQAADAAGRELEALFGDQVGPRVRGVFEKWFESRAGNFMAPQLGPMQQQLGQVMSRAEEARFQSEEQSFENRHRKVLTPAVRAKVIELGESGEFVPGRNQPPSKYLDSLLRVALSETQGQNAFNASRNASTRLAEKIRANRDGREPSGISGRGGVKKVSAVKAGMSISQALDAAAREMDMEE